MPSMICTLISFSSKSLYRLLIEHLRTSFSYVNVAVSGIQTRISSTWFCISVIIAKQVRQVPNGNYNYHTLSQPRVQLFQESQQVQVAILMKHKLTGNNLYLLNLVGQCHNLMNYFQYYCLKINLKITTISKIDIAISPQKYQIKILFDCYLRSIQTKHYDALIRPVQILNDQVLILGRLLWEAVGDWTAAEEPLVAWNCQRCYQNVGRSLASRVP